MIFHNLASYDANLFIKNLGVTAGKGNCVADNEEKYISFKKQIFVDAFINKEDKSCDSKGEIRFIDS